MTPHPSVQAIIDTIAGALGGTVCVLSGQPLDTIKVKMQTFPLLYSGFLHCFISTYRQNGLQGLYQGTTPALLANITENSVLFMSYGFCQEFVRMLCGTPRGSSLSNLEKACSGSLASLFSSVAICPTILVKCRMQAMQEMSALGKVPVGNVTVWSVMCSVMHSDGPLGFFQGLTSTMAREVPGYFCFFGAYEMCRSIFAEYLSTSKENIGVMATMLSGGVGGVSYWLAAYPMDCVNSRIQVLSMTTRQAGFLRTLLSIIKAEGVRALYSGLIPTLIRTFPANAALFLAYEASRNMMMRQFNI